MQKDSMNTDLAFLNGVFITINELLACCTSEDMTMNQIVEYMSNFEFNKNSKLRLTYMKSNLTKDIINSQLEIFQNAVPQDWEEFVFNKVKESILEKTEKDFLLVPNVIIHLISNNHSNDIVDFFKKQNVYIQQLLSYESGRNFGYKFIKTMRQMYENDYNVRFNSQVLGELEEFRHLIFNLIEENSYLY